MTVTRTLRLGLGFFFLALNGGCADNVASDGMQLATCACKEGPPGPAGISVHLLGPVNQGAMDCEGAGGYSLSYGEIPFLLCHGVRGKEGGLGSQGPQGLEGPEGDRGPPGALVAIRMNPTIFGASKLQVGTPVSFRDDPDMRNLFGNFFIQVHCGGTSPPPNFPEDGYFIPAGWTKIHWESPTCDDQLRAYLEVGIGALASGWDVTGPDFLYRRNISGPLYRVKQPATPVQATVQTYSSSAFCNPPQPRTGTFYELEPSGFAFPAGVVSPPAYTSSR